MTGTNLVIAVLNWRSLAQPSSCPPSIRLGFALNGEQRGIVRRLEVKVRVLVRHGEVGPADMGRAAARVESLEGEISRLVEIGQRLGESARSYSLGRTGACPISQPSCKMPCCNRA